MKMRIQYLIYLLILVAMGACLGNIAPVCDSPTATIAQTWQLEQLTLNDSVVVADSSYQEHLLATGHYFVDTPVARDGSLDAGIKRRDGVWEFSADQSQVIFDKGSDAEVRADIVTLECQELVLAYEVVHPVWGKGVLKFAMKQVGL